MENESPNREEQRMNESSKRSAARVVPFLFVLAFVIGSIAWGEVSAIDLPAGGAPTIGLSTPPSFAPGDVLISLRTGEVQWRSRDGALVGVLVNAIPGKAEGVGFDAAGNLYVSHYCADISVCLTGDSVEKFSPPGGSLGAFGSGYNCNPYAFAFDRAGRGYVGQADCTGDIRQLDASGVFRTAFDVAHDLRGSARIDLVSDGCTKLYTSQRPSVKRFDVCSNRQLPDFNAAP